MIEEVKTLLGISEDDRSKDDIITFIIKRVEKRVCSYCNVKSVPKGLEETVLFMVVDTYRSTQYGQEKVDSEMKGMTEGDVSWSYQTASQIAIEKIKNPSLIEDYKSELNSYRKLRWPK